MDNNPGDRAADCGGMMEPLRIEGSTGQYRIVHKCSVCGVERRVSASPDDNTDALLALASKNAGAIMGP